MKEVVVTITSKNQITLPAEYVRRMKLTKSRQMSLRRRGDGIVLVPIPSLEERMKKHWHKLPPFKGTKTDTELKRAIRNAFANKKI